MITRLLAIFLYASHSRAQNDRNCPFRVDVLDGSNLPEGLAIFLKEKTAAQNPEECALNCYKKTCDVAYFHHSSLLCQFTANSSTTESSQSCEDVFGERQLEGIKEIDTVFRYCISCRNSTPSGEQTAFSREILSQQVAETVPIQKGSLREERLQNRTYSWETWNKSQPISRGRMTFLRVQGRLPSFSGQLVRNNMRMPSSTIPRIYTAAWGTPQFIHQISREKVQKTSLEKTASQKKQYHKKFFHKASYPLVMVPEHMKQKGFGIAK